MKNLLLLLLLALFFLLDCSGQSLEKIEHGWKGKYLTAYRMNSNWGRNIQIVENDFMGNIDRAEVSKLIEDNGGTIISGDAMGLDMVLFKDMNTKAKQDSVIKSILPKLDKLYESF